MFFEGLRSIHPIHEDYIFIGLLHKQFFENLTIKFDYDEKSPIANTDQSICINSLHNVKKIDFRLYDTPIHMCEDSLKMITQTQSTTPKISWISDSDQICSCTYADTFNTQMITYQLNLNIAELKCYNSSSEYPYSYVEWLKDHQSECHTVAKMAGVVESAICKESCSKDINDINRFSFNLPSGKKAFATLELLSKCKNYLTTKNNF